MCRAAFHVAYLHHSVIRTLELDYNGAWESTADKKNSLSANWRLIFSRRIPTGHEPGIERWGAQTYSGVARGAWPPNF